MAMILAFLIALAVANACPTGCSTCTGTTCTGCEIGFYLSGTACLACTANCQQCQNGANCDVCNSGYRKLIGSSTCVACGASSCTESQYYNSNLCVGGDFDNGCRACSTGDCPMGQWQSAGCTATADRVCVACSTSCLTGTYKSADCSATADITCSVCALTIPGCQACDYVSGTLTCSSCGDGSDGYYLTDGTCVACSTACANGYHRTSLCSATLDMGCSPCTPECALASGTYESVACTTLTDRQCSACSAIMANCATCSSASTCSSCQTSYYVSGGGSGCTGCFHSNCATCSAGNYASCTACKPGLYLNSAEQNCTACSGTACPAGQYQSAACSATADRVCSTCATSCSTPTIKKLYGVCSGDSNRACFACSTALSMACGTGTKEGWWPSNRQTCCDSRDLTATCSVQYQYVLDCTQLYTVHNPL